MDRLQREAKSIQNKIVYFIEATQIDRQESDFVRWVSDQKRRNIF